MNLDCDLKKGACYINLGEIAKYLVHNYQGEKEIMAGWKIDEGKKRTCHAQLLAVTIRVIRLVGFSVEVVLPGLVH